MYDVTVSDGICRLYVYVVVTLLYIVCVLSGFYECIKIIYVCKKHFNTEKILYSELITCMQKDL